MTRPLGTGPGEAFDARPWLTDPSARTLDRPAVGRRFWIGTLTAALTSVGATIFLLISVWAIFS